MALESTFNILTDLNPNNPVATDTQTQGDDHIRGIKNALLKTFKGYSSTVSASPSELNILRGATITTGALNILAPVTTLGATVIKAASTSSMKAALDLNTGTSGHVLAYLDENPSWGGGGTFRIIHETSDTARQVLNIRTVAHKNAPGTALILRKGVYDADATGSATSVFANTNLGILRYSGCWGGGSYRDGAILTGETTEDWSSGGAGARLKVQVAANGSTGTTIRWIFENDGSLNYTGLASQGAGTINANAIYDNGVKLTTCYALAMEIWGDLRQGNNEKGRAFQQRAAMMLDPDQYEAFWRANGHLPAFPSASRWREEEKSMNVGNYAQRLLETMEVFAVHISRLNARIKASESRISAVSSVALQNLIGVDTGNRSRTVLQREDVRIKSDVAALQSRVAALELLHTP